MDPNNSGKSLVKNMSEGDVDEIASHMVDRIRIEELEHSKLQQSNSMQEEPSQAMTETQATSIRNERIEFDDGAAEELVMRVQEGVHEIVKKTTTELKLEINDANAALTVASLLADD